MVHFYAPFYAMDMEILALVYGIITDIALLIPKRYKLRGVGVCPRVVPGSPKKEVG